ncbi:MAG: hypothetical protein LH465_00045 [Sphingomonas bacterium]|nr:hypothetical protein [Sphingomonas bacterium]
MVDATIAEQAEKLSAQRARMFPLLAVIYLGQQYSYFSSLDGGRPVDAVRIGAWAVMSAALLIALVTGGGLMRKRELRAMLNDETSKAHRSDALGWGFVVAMITGIVLYVIGSTAVGERDAIHLIVSLGIATALVRFGWLEKRAMRGE